MYHHLIPVDPCQSLETAMAHLRRQHERYFSKIDAGQVRDLLLRLVRPRCYFDITVDAEPMPRLVLELAYDVAPKTCSNFRALCMGERGVGQEGRPLHYKGTSIFRIVPGFVCQGGDFVSDDGLGSDSIFGGDFDDENFELKHHSAGIVSMANDGPGTNGSQFFLTCGPAPHLDGAHVVFGQVVQGMETIARMDAVGTNDDDDEDNDGKVTKPVVIVDCGVLLENHRHCLVDT